MFTKNFYGKSCLTICPRSPPEFVDTSFESPCIEQMPKAKDIILASCRVKNSRNKTCQFDENVKIS